MSDSSGAPGAAGALGEGGSQSAGSGAGGAPALAPVDPIGVYEQGFDTSSAADVDAALTLLVGTYDVAIYFAQEGKESDLGAGSIQVAYDGDIIHLTLKNAAGKAIADVKNSRSSPTNYGQATFTKVLGKILVDDRDSDAKRIDVTLSTNGNITGYVGGAGEFYHFRNNVVAYGPALPQHLLTQVGTWSGAQLAKTCGQPPVTVDVGSDGSVKISGTGNLDCMEHEIANKWDGQDDYVVPAAYGGGLDVVIDEAKGGGSEPEGGIWLTVDKDPSVVGIQDARTTLTGAEGNLEVANPQPQ